MNNHGVLLLFTPKTPYWFEGSQYIDFTMYWITTAGFWGTFVLAFQKYDDKNIIFGSHIKSRSREKNISDRDRTRKYYFLEPYKKQISRKKYFRPWQDSNLQSPDPKSGALSIRPHGRLYIHLIFYSIWRSVFLKDYHFCHLIFISKIDLQIQL